MTAHEMTLKNKDKTGRQLWVCPECGRKLILRWEPYEKVILENGQEEITHTGTTMPGMRIGASVVPSVDNTMSDEDLAFLAGLGIDWEKE